MLCCVYGVTVTVGCDNIVVEIFKATMIVDVQVVAVFGLVKVTVNHAMVCNVSE